MTYLFAVLALVQPQQLSADEVVQRLYKAYDSVKRFQQVTSCQVARNLRDIVTITFHRPASLQMWTDEMVEAPGLMGGYSPFLSSDGSHTQLIDGSRLAMPSVHTGIERLDGLTHAGATVVPLLLTRDKPFVKALQGPKSVSLSDLNGRPVYELTLLGPHPLSLFIDPKTFMVIRTSKGLDKPLVIDFQQPTIDKPFAKVMTAQL